MSFLFCAACTQALIQLFVVRSHQPRGKCLPLVFSYSVTPGVPGEQSGRPQPSAFPSLARVYGHGDGHMARVTVDQYAIVECALQVEARCSAERIDGTGSQL